MNTSLLGIEIGGTKIQLTWGNASAHPLHRQRLHVDPRTGAPGIQAQIESALKDTSHPSPQAVGIGFGGPIDWRTGRVCCSHQISGWVGFDLREWISRHTGAPTRVDNDANTAALAEAVLGAGRGHDSVFYTTLGSGVGGGFVVDQCIFHGQLPGEAEIGHLRLDREGNTVEARCSGWAVNRRICEAIAANPHGALAQWIARDPGHEARHLTSALAENDPAAVRILNELVDDLAFALSHVTHVVHPSILVLGGGLSLIGQPLQTGIAQRLPAYLMQAFQPGPPVALAELAEDAVPVGALLLAQQALASKPPPGTETH